MYLVCFHCTVTIISIQVENCKPSVNQTQPEVTEGKELIPEPISSQSLLSLWSAPRRELWSGPISSLEPARGWERGGGGGLGRVSRMKETGKLIGKFEIYPKETIWACLKPVQSLKDTSNRSTPLTQYYGALYLVTCNSKRDLEG